MTAGGRPPFRIAQDIPIGRSRLDEFPVIDRLDDERLPAERDPRLENRGWQARVRTSHHVADDDPEAGAAQSPVARRR